MNATEDDVREVNAVAMEVARVVRRLTGDPGFVSFCLVRGQPDRRGPARTSISRSTEPGRSTLYKWLTSARRARDCRHCSV